MTQNKTIAFPKDPFFEKLLHAAHLYPSHAIILDDTLNIQATYGQLLQDANNVRQSIRQNLPAGMFDSRGIVREDDVFFGLHMPGNYEFIVALIACLALGVAVIPFPTGLIPEEACVLVKQWNVVCVMVGSNQSLLAESIQNTNLTTIVHVTTTTAAQNNQSFIPPVFKLDDQLTFSPERSSLLLFTSGTTGSPKGALHARRFFYSGQGFLNPCLHSDVFLLNRPVSWVGSMRRIVEILLTGGRLSIMDQTSSSRPGEIWERLRKGDVTIVSMAARDWLQLMNYYEKNLSVTLTAETLEEYVRGVRALRVAQSTGWMPPVAVKKFWYGILGERALEIAYASTEAGAVITSSDPNTLDLNACIGRPVSKVDVKLSSDTHGEILVKTLTMFKGYLNDPLATQTAFDGEYFRSGDLAHIQNDGRIIIDGRERTGFARFCGLVVPLIEVESAISRLPYIQEAFILAVSDPRSQTQVAALIRTHHHHPKSTTTTTTTLDIIKLRQDLSSLLPLYQLPTLLYVLREEEHVPRTLSGKLDIKGALRVFFGSEGEYAELRLPEGVQRLERDSMGVLKERRMRPWDWAGLQV